MAVVPGKHAEFQIAQIAGTAATLAQRFLPAWVQPVVAGVVDDPGIVLLLPGPVP
jgi:hypothetical protein